MTRRYRFYINGGISERMLAAVRADFPPIFDSHDQYPFTVPGNPPEYFIDKIVEPIDNFSLNQDESYFDVVFADRPAGATSHTDEQWFDTLIRGIKDQILIYNIISEQLDV